MPLRATKAIPEWNDDGTVLLKSPETLQQKIIGEK